MAAEANNKHNLLQIYLSKFTRVALLTGEKNCLAYGQSNLHQNHEQIISLIKELRGINSATPEFEGKSIEIGEMLADEIVSSSADTDGHVRQLITSITKDISIANNLEISFIFDDPRYLEFPVELIRSRANDPISTTNPVSSSVMEPGQLMISQAPDYCQSKLKGESKKLNVLLISSNTEVRQGEQIFLGDQPSTADFQLQGLDGIDNDSGECKRIKQIIEARVNPLYVNVEHLDSGQINCQDFLDLVGIDRYHIIHYNGHGFAKQTSNDRDLFPDSFIFFRDREHGCIGGVNPLQLQGRMRGCGNLKLLYLSCCQSASGNTYGFLESARKANIPYVIGMRWPIYMSNCRNIAERFYTNLFSSESMTIERAVMKTRSELIGNNDRSVWCSPVLVKMHTPAYARQLNVP